MTGFGAPPPPVRLGRLVLYEPLNPASPDGPWVGREDGRVELVVVDRPDHLEEFHRPDLSRLTHPALESLLDRRREAGRWVQIRELVMGVRLERLLQALADRGEMVPLSVVRAWIGAAVTGLRYLEGALADGRPLGLRHGALGPASTWITFSGQARLGDHQLIRLHTPDETPTAGDDAEAARRDAAGLVQLLAVTLEAPEAGPAGSMRHADVPAALRDAVDRWRRAGVDPVVSFSDFAARLEPLLSLLPPPVDDAQVADWMRARVPEAERDALARLRRIRNASARMTPELPPREETPVRPALSIDVRPEPFEPSVITMPGAELGPGRVVDAEPITVRGGGPGDSQRIAPRTTPRSGRRKRRPRRRVHPALAALGLGMVVAGGWALGYWLVTAPDDPERPRAHSPEEIDGPTPDNVGVRGADPKSSRRGSPRPSLPTAEASGAGGSAGQIAPNAGSAGASDPGSKASSTPVVSPAQAKAPPREVAGSEPVGSEAAVSLVQGLLVAAEAAPGDAAAYEAVLGQLRAEAERLPAERAEELRAVIRRAELAWSLDALRSAVERWRELSR